MRKFFIVEEIIKFLIEGCGYSKEDAAHFLLDLTMYWDEEDAKEAYLHRMTERTYKKVPREE